ncbi:MAG: hypothetical protein ACXWEW_11460, partial [Nitrososphaeraceae archaeon]
DYEEADKSRLQFQRARNSKIVDGSPDSLIAGPKSGMWKEDEIFVNKEKDNYAIIFLLQQQLLHNKNFRIKILWYAFIYFNCFVT